MHMFIDEDYHTNKQSAGKLSTTAFPPKSPRPSGLYDTIPIPSFLKVQKYQYKLTNLTMLN